MMKEIILALTTNRLFKEGGYGHTFGIDGRYRFKKSYTATFEFSKSLIKEPNASWIEENDRVGEYNTLLDGEKKNGDALYFSLLRNTKHWNSKVEYKQYSPQYQSSLGFITQNSIRNMIFSHGYQHFFDKEKIIKQLEVNLKSKLNFNYSSLRKYFDIGSSLFM